VRLSGDHLVLDLGKDECGFHDVADAAGIDGDVLEGPSALLQQGEAAFALVAQAAQQHVAGFRASVKLAFAGFFHRHADSGADSLVIGIGEAGNDCQPRPQAGQDKLAGGADVVRRSGPRVRGPQRDAGRGDDALDESGVLVCLPGVPFVDLW
jgi:hypothetical protein